MDNRNLVRDSIKYALPSLPLMYLNFFIDAGARSYSADLTGRFFNAILENQYAAARGLLGGMIAMVLVCTLFLPLWAMLTNALYFSLSLKYDLRVTSAFYAKRYERMRAFETGEVAERIFRDPDDLLTLIAEIVMRESGGVRIDTLFIDEGFGSLDETALDEAVAVLTQLGEGSRLVGIVSHVAELRERIDRQIIVTARPGEGSQVRLVTE